MVKKYGELYLEARQALRETEGQNAANAARELLAFASGKSTAALMADRELYASEQIGAKLQDYVARMKTGEPLAYILGQWSFYGLTLTVTPDALIPRDDTAAVTDLAVEALRAMEPPQRVLDLGTGTGCIGLAVAHSVDSARVTLADCSPEALKLAKQNAADLGLKARAVPVQLDMKKPAPAFLGEFDLIVSNPPYVTKKEMQTLEPSVRKFEPHLALDGGEDGLDFYRAIVKNFTGSLKDGGFFCLEFGLGQHEAVGALLREAGRSELRFAKDTGGIIRAVRAKKDKTNV